MKQYNYHSKSHVLLRALLHVCARCNLLSLQLTLHHLVGDNYPVALLWHWLAYLNRLSHRCDTHSLGHVHSRSRLDSLRQRHSWLLFVGCDSNVSSSRRRLELTWADSLLSLYSVKWWGSLDLRQWALVHNIDLPASLLGLDELLLLGGGNDVSDLVLCNHCNWLLRCDYVLLVPLDSLVDSSVVLFSGLPEFVEFL